MKVTNTIPAVLGKAVANLLREGVDGYEEVFTTKKLGNLLVNAQAWLVLLVRLAWIVELVGFD